MNVTITTCPAKLEEVYRFRYSVYVDEMNRQQRYADDKHRRIEDPLDNFGHVLVAHDGNQLVGTLRINFLREGSIGVYTALYGLGDLSESEAAVTSITTRLMIAKQYRSGTLAVRLSIAVFEFALANGIHTDFIDCNPPLDNFFSKLGHKKVQDIAHPEYGDVVLMKLDLRDRDYLCSIGSPFAKQAPHILSTKQGTKNVHT